MARIFEIVPTTMSVRGADGRVGHDDRVMYLIGEDAEQALDEILEPYGSSGAWYLNMMHAKAPGPWAYVALRREYDIADALARWRRHLGNNHSIRFASYDARNLHKGDYRPKVACFLFPTKETVGAATEVIRFLWPAWSLLRDKQDDRHWLVVLDEDPAEMQDAAS